MKTFFNKNVLYNNKNIEKKIKISKINKKFSIKSILNQ